MSVGRSIALVTDALEAGGLETALLATGRALAEADYRPHVVTTRAPGAWFDAAAAHGLPATCIGPGHSTGLVPTLAHVRRVAAFLAGFDGALLAHAHDAQAGLGLLPDRMALVSILQCDVDEVYDVGLAGAGVLQAVVGVSPAIAARARARVKARTHVACIPNFTDVAGRRPPRPAPVNGLLRLLFVGRLVPHKGVRHLVPVLSRLRAEGIDARLEVFGDGPERATLAHAVAQAGLARAVTLRGLASPAEVRAAMRSSDALLLPSESEGLPLVVVEAMAEGLVPVVSRLEVVRELVTPGTDGLLFDSGDEAGMVGALRLLADAGLRERLSVGAHATALTRFSAAACGPLWVRLFEDAFAGRIAPRLPRRWALPIHPGPIVPWCRLVPAGVRALVRPLRRRAEGR